MPQGNGSLRDLTRISTRFSPDGRRGMAMMKITRGAQRQGGRGGRVGRIGSEIQPRRPQGDGRMNNHTGKFGGGNPTAVLLYGGCHRNGFSESETFPHICENFLNRIIVFAILPNCIIPISA